MKKLPVVKIARTTVLLVAGLLGLAHETVVAEAERPTLVLGFLALCGLPVFLNKEEKE